MLMKSTKEAEEEKLAKEKSKGDWRLTKIVW